jgi:CHAT domain-containing protein/tetratricopeptide (TPR) repeat protein
MRPDQQAWLFQLNATWMQNAPLATLHARLQPRWIDEAVLRYVDEQVRQVRGAGVIAGGLGRLTGSLFGPGPQQEFMAATQVAGAEAFYHVLELIAEGGGDPLTEPELQSAALPILRGAVPLGDALRIGGGTIERILPGAQRLVDLAGRVGADPAPLLGSLAMVAAALALPRPQLLAQFGLTAQAPATEAASAGPVPAAAAPDAFQALLQQADAMSESDPQATERLLVQALDTAARSQSAEDDIAAIRYLLLFSGRFRLSGETLRTCVDRVRALVDGMHGGDDLAQVVSFLVPQVAQADLADELSVPLSEAGTALLQGKLLPVIRASLAVATAEARIRSGRPDLAAQILKELRQTDLSSDDTLRAAQAEANLLHDFQDRDGAADVLLRALDATRGADPSVRLTALGTLITVWPKGREGRGAKMEEMREEADRMEEPLRTAALVQVVHVLRQEGRLEEARHLVAGIDFSGFRAAAGAQLGSWLDDIERWIEEEPEARAAGSDEPDVQPTTAAGLGLARQFGPAAEASLTDAQRSLARGFRIHAFDNLAAAGKFFQMAGENERAIEAFERAFAMFEHDVVYLPRASYVVRRLADWPEIYTRAALAALGIGNPEKAVDLAETGRSRAIGNRVGPSARWRPQAAPPELWDQYARAWRTAVARAVNELVDTDRPGSDVQSGALEDELDELRERLLAEGVPPEELTPLATPVRASEMISRLRRASRPTTVLYSIRLDDQDLRFVRLTADGASEISIGEDDQRTILQECDRYLAALRDNRGQIYKTIRDLLPRLMKRIEGPLGTVLARALDRQSDGRLLWIPQGSLVAVPIAACPCDDGMLVDRAAVMVAPSLTLGAPAAEPDVAVASIVRPIRGQTLPRQAPTDGGDRLLSVVTEAVPPEVVPESIEEWNHVVADVSLVHVTCHGVYDWDDPLRSHLKLGFDLSVLDLFDQTVLRPGALVVFGTCDSGTVAQGDINEAVGFPTAMLTSGAEAVVGAGWPVARPAAVSECLQFFRGLREGLASPEALQAAMVWARDATVGQLVKALADVSHPLAEDPLLLKRTKDSQDKLLAPVYYWASYVHWGGSCRMSEASEAVHARA